jgi:hypothetical protein
LTDIETHDLCPFFFAEFYFKKKHHSFVTISRSSAKECNLEKFLGVDHASAEITCR